MFMPYRTSFLSQTHTLPCHSSGNLSQFLNLKHFMGLTLNTGKRQKYNELRSYWSTDPIHHKPMFFVAMSRQRYENIMCFMHFNEIPSVIPLRKGEKVYLQEWSTTHSEVEGQTGCINPVFDLSRHDSPNLHGIWFGLSMFTTIILYGRSRLQWPNDEAVFSWRARRWYKKSVHIFISIGYIQFNQKEISIKWNSIFTCSENINLCESSRKNDR